MDIYSYLPRYSAPLFSYWKTLHGFIVWQGAANSTSLNRTAAPLASFACWSVELMKPEEPQFALLCSTCKHDRMVFPHTPGSACPECSRHGGPCASKEGHAAKLAKAWQKEQEDLPKDLEDVGRSLARMLHEPGGCLFVPIYIILFFISWHFAWKVTDWLMGDPHFESTGRWLVRYILWCVLFGLMYIGSCWPLRRVQRSVFKVKD